MTDDTSNKEGISDWKIAKKTLAASFLAVNLVSGIGAFQASNADHANPESTATDIAQNIIYRPKDNATRYIYGDYTKAKRWNYEIPHGDNAIDAKLCRTLGNVFNREKSPYRNDISMLTILTMVPATIITTPASYIGGMAGALAGEIGLHFEQ